MIDGWMRFKVMGHSFWISGWVFVRMVFTMPYVKGGEASGRTCIITDRNGPGGVGVCDCYIPPRLKTRIFHL